MNWTTIDTWMVVIGALCAVACALPGCFMVLRKMSMMGDAISHAVLPGIAIAFLITGSRDVWTMAIGAAIVGVLTAVLTQAIHQWGRVDEGASMGVVFTTLFAIGLILIVRAADSVDLDPGCVLYGALELAPLDMRSVLGWHVPRAAIILGSAVIVNALFVVLFYKELRISSFDPALATTMGINATAMHFALMVIVALTTVAAFEVVGSILVVAMIIVPGAAANLLTDRLWVMLLLSAVIAAAGALVGHMLAIVGPGWFGFAGQSTNTAGMMAVATGGLFLIAMFAAPRHGVISKLAHRGLLVVRIVREDALGFLYRLEELELGRREPVDGAMMRDAIGCGRASVALAILGLRRARLVHTESRDRGLALTERGRRLARSLVRSHRLWETYLAKHFDVPIDHVHGAAMKLEHITDEAMQQRLAEETSRPAFDPHGRRVPGEE